MSLPRARAITAGDNVADRGERWPTTLCLFRREPGKSLRRGREPSGYGGTRALPGVRPPALDRIAWGTRPSAAQLAPPPITHLAARSALAEHDQVGARIALFTGPDVQREGIAPQRGLLVPRQIGDLIDCFRDVAERLLC